MKILIINTVPTGRNGITNVIFNYLSTMNPRDHLCDYVSLNSPSPEYDAIIKRIGGKVYILKRSLRFLPSYFIKLHRIIRDNAYDIVHIHGNSHTIIIELLAAKFARCDVRIAHAHSTKCNSILIHKALTPFFNLLCTHRLACGKEAGVFMFGQKPFTVMNNGVKTEVFGYNDEIRKKIRERLGWTDNKVIGHVGYFLPIKNQSFIIDIFESLYKQNPKYRLILIGDGPMKKVIEEKISYKNLTKAVALTGNVDNVNEYLNAIDVIVMPSLFEGLPLTLIEQQANGLICVVSDNITREVDRTGNLRFLSLNAPIENWAKALQKEDEALREERSRKAIESISNAGYSIIEQARRLEEFYTKAKEES